VVSPSLAIPMPSSLPIIGSPKKLVSAPGLNAYVNTKVSGIQGTPPNETVCEGAGFVFEGVNNVFEVYDASLASLASPVADSAFFLPALSGIASPDLYEPACYYDPDTGRWFVVEGLEDFSTDSSYVLFAASQSQSPLGSWNLYRLTTTDLAKPDCPCFADFVKLGVNADALFVSVDEIPRLRINGLLNGAQLYVVDKLALEAAAKPNVVHLDLGALPTPDGPCNTTTGSDCWTAVSPAQSPDAAYETGFGGTEYLLSALDFSQTLDNRIELWAVTNTATIHTSPSLRLLRRTLSSETYGAPPFAAQKAGPIPLGDAQTPPQPESPISTLGNVVPDGMQHVSFASGGLVWGALNTIVQSPAVHSGIAYFGVQPMLNPDGSGGSVAAQGYIANSAEDVLAPAITATTTGHAVLAYTLTGADYYPSTAFSRLTAKKPPASIDIADLGQSPIDESTEYSPVVTDSFGFDAAAVADGKQVFFGSEYVQSPNCPDSVYNSDPTCGATRTQYTNWGTSLNSTPAKKMVATQRATTTKGQDGANPASADRDSPD
jgi:hypothetical protein